MYKPVCLCLFLCSIVILKLPGQTLEISNDFTDTLLAFHLEYLEDPSQSLTFEDVTAPGWTDRFVRNQQLTPAYGFNRSRFWFRFSIDNPGKAQDLVLNVGRILEGEMNLFILSPDRCILQKTIRVGEDIKKREIENTSCTFKIPSFKGVRQFYVSVETEVRANFKFHLHSVNSWNTLHLTSNTIAGIFTGIFLSAWLFSIIMYYSLKESLYLRYSFVVLTFTLLHIVMCGFGPEFYFPQFERISNWFPQYLGQIFNIAYLFYLRKFLNLRIQHHILDNLILSLILICFLSLLLPFFLPIRTVAIIFLTLQAEASLVVLITIVISLLKGDRAALFPLTGSLLLTGAFSIHTIFESKLLWLSAMALRPDTIAIAIDFFLLLIGISVRINQLRLEREKVERSKQEAQITALCAQMNPHFISNVMNSINNFILKNDTRHASSYLVRFNKLIRNVLHNSGKAFINFQELVETLDLYLQMEKLRLRDKLSYRIRIDQRLNPQAIQVPPMLIQPILENAVWHGISPKKGRGKVLLDFSCAGDFLKVVVEDDGVGRNPGDWTQKKRTSPNSIGMSLVQQRLAIINGREGAPIEVTDLQDGTGKPSGTRITLQIRIR